MLHWYWALISWFIKHSKCLNHCATKNIWTLQSTYTTILTQNRNHDTVTLKNTWISLHWKQISNQVASVNKCCWAFLWTVIFSATFSIICNEIISRSFFVDVWSQVSQQNNHWCSSLTFEHVPQSRTTRKCPRHFVFILNNISVGSYSET